MIYKLTSVKTVIYQVMTDLNISDTDVQIDDFIEWIGRALQHIGCHYQLTEKEAIIEIENYKGELPCDLYQVSRMIYNNRRLHNNESLIGSTQNQINNNSFTGIDYNITHNIITTAFESGEIVIQYTAFPVDEEGLPLVPDNPSFKDACFWRCVYQLCIRGYEFKNTQLRDIQYTKKMWNDYCRSARAAGNMPNLDMTQRLLNNYLRLKVDKNQHWKFFADNGRQESLSLGGKSYNTGNNYR